MSYLVPSGSRGEKLDISPATDNADVGADVTTFRYLADYFANEGAMARWLLDLLSSLFNFALRQRFPDITSLVVFTRFGYGGGQNQIVVNLDHRNFESPEKILARIECSARVVILNDRCSECSDQGKIIADFLGEWLENSGMGEFTVRYWGNRADKDFLEKGKSYFRPVIPDFG